MLGDKEGDVHRYGCVRSECQEILEVVAVVRHLEAPCQSWCNFFTHVGEGRAGELVAILHRRVATRAFHVDGEYLLFG